MKGMYDCWAVDEAKEVCKDRSIWRSLTTPIGIKRETKLSYL